MIRQTLCIIFMTSAIGVVCSGCGDTAARGLATDTLQTTVTYEKSIDDKTNAEKGFYATQRNNLLRPIFGYVPVDENASASDNDSRLNDISVTDSLYYGSIVVSSQRDGSVVADKLIGANGKVALAPLFTYLDDGVTGERNDYNTLVVKQAQLSIRLTTGLAQLDSEAAKLAAVRAQLIKLSQKQTPVGEIQQLAQLGSSVRTLVTANQVSSKQSSAVHTPSQGQKANQ